jgi:hypothetical protein
VEHKGELGLGLYKGVWFGLNGTIEHLELLYTYNLLKSKILPLMVSG